MKAKRIVTMLLSLAMLATTVPMAMAEESVSLECNVANATAVTNVGTNGTNLIKLDFGMPVASLTKEDVTLFVGEQEVEDFEITATTRGITIDPMYFSTLDPTMNTESIYPTSGTACRIVIDDEVLGQHEVNFTSGLILPVPYKENYRIVNVSSGLVPTLADGFGFMSDRGSIGVLTDGIIYQASWTHMFTVTRPTTDDFTATAGDVFYSFDLGEKYEIAGIAIAGSQLNTGNNNFYAVECNNDPDTDIIDQNNAILWTFNYPNDQAVCIGYDFNTKVFTENEVLTNFNISDNECQYVHIGRSLKSGDLSASEIMIWAYADFEEPSTSADFNFDFTKLTAGTDVSQQGVTASAVNTEKKSVAEIAQNETAGVLKWTTDGQTAKAYLTVDLPKDISFANGPVTIETTAKLADGFLDWFATPYGSITGGSEVTSANVGFITYSNIDSMRLNLVKTDDVGPNEYNTIVKANGYPLTRDNVKNAYYTYRYVIDPSSKTYEFSFKREDETTWTTPVFTYNNVTYTPQTGELPEVMTALKFRTDYANGTAADEHSIYIKSIKVKQGMDIVSTMPIENGTLLDNKATVTFTEAITPSALTAQNVVLKENNIALAYGTDYTVALDEADAKKVIVTLAGEPRKGNKYKIEFGTDFAAASGAKLGEVKTVSFETPTWGFSHKWDFSTYTADTTLAEMGLSNDATNERCMILPEEKVTYTSGADIKIVENAQVTYTKGEETVTDTFTALCFNPKSFAQAEVAENLYFNLPEKLYKDNGNIVITLKMRAPENVKFFNGTSTFIGNDYNSTDKIVKYFGGHTYLFSDGQRAYFKAMESNEYLDAVVTTYAVLSGTIGRPITYKWVIDTEDETYKLYKDSVLFTTTTNPDGVFKTGDIPEVISQLKFSLYEHNADKLNEDAPYYIEEYSVQQYYIGECTAQADAENKITVNVSKNAAETTDTCVIALYNKDNILKEIKANVANGATVLDSTYAQDDYIKVFLWNGLDKLEPYCEAVRVNITK